MLSRVCCEPTLVFFRIDGIDGYTANLPSSIRIYRKDTFVSRVSTKSCVLILEKRSKDILCVVLIQKKEDPLTFNVEHVLV